MHSIVRGTGTPKDRDEVNKLGNKLTLMKAFCKERKKKATRQRRSNKMEDEEEEVCRYCFEGADEGDLISPCNCKGGQKWVHLKCLRRWQRMVLVSQPTHPAMQRDDIRHHKCNVCSSTFTCAPPTRHELMQSFTGPEIAALIEEGCIIASGEPFSEELQRQIAHMPAHMRLLCSYDHWIHGVYLITGVTEDEREFPWHVTDDETLAMVRERLDESLKLKIQGKKLRLAAAGALAGVAPSDLADALARLRAPCTVIFEADGEVNCGDDHIIAVNLTRRIQPPVPSEVAKAVKKIAAAYPKAAPQLVEVTHFKGGPCDEDTVVSCLVFGGPTRGWSVVPNLTDAIKLATSRALRRHGERQGDVSAGQTVLLKGLVARPDLNGEIGLALKFASDSGRWLVRLRNGEGKQVKPSNLVGQEGAHGRVYVFWGDARWSRAQLLGEIARGHWGLCRASVTDVAGASTRSQKASVTEVEARLIFAPVTEMTEDFLREMNNARAGALIVRAEQQQAEEEEEGSGRQRSDSLISLSDADVTADAAAALSHAADAAASVAAVAAAPADAAATPLFSVTDAPTDA